MLRNQCNRYATILQWTAYGALFGLATFGMLTIGLKIGLLSQPPVDYLDINKKYMKTHWPSCYDVDITHGLSMARCSAAAKAASIHALEELTWHSKLNNTAIFYIGITGVVTCAMLGFMYGVHVTTPPALYHRFFDVPMQKGGNARSSPNPIRFEF